MSSSPMGGTSGVVLDTPVVLMVFNRPAETAKVFQQIAKAKPRTLFVVADGPRPNRPDDIEKCAAVRQIVKQVDWDCDLRTNFADTNIGMRKRVPSGLNWVFEQVEEAIILEDDCVPHPTFFKFCAAILEKYRDDHRIMSVTGTYEYTPVRQRYSYHFSKYTNIWGWASWRRAWQFYDVDMTLWPLVRDEKWLYDLLGDNEIVLNYWHRIFQKTFDRIIDTWDYQWLFALLVQGGLTVVPNVNLISNIGFSEEASHTKRADHRANRPTFEITFPLVDPPHRICDRQEDRLIERALITRHRKLVRGKMYLHGIMRALLGDTMR